VLFRSGIRPAVESGLIAATTIVEAGGDYRRAQLLPYSSRLVTRFGAESVPTVGEPACLRSFFAGILMESRWFTRHVVLDRWFLHRHQTAMHAT
jgi:hypothetical protein